jgi:hypothetical protein
MLKINNLTLQFSTRNLGKYEEKIIVIFHVKIMI